MASACHLIITKLSSWTILSLLSNQVVYCFAHDKVHGKRHTEILLVKGFLVLHFIVDNCEVVRPVDKIGKVQGVVPVLGRERAKEQVYC